MAFPTILINSATGSNTTASGAGPATAVSGTANGTSNGATPSVVTLGGSPDLSGVATDGSAALYLNTVAGRKFSIITAVDNVGKTVTIEDTITAGNGTNRDWAIGGKRASLNAATSLVLVDQGGTAGDAKAGWVIEWESGHTETFSNTLDVRVTGNTTAGPFVLRGAAGAATRPVITFSNNGNGIVPRSSFQEYRDFDLLNTNATKTASTAFVCTTTDQGLIDGVKLSHSTNRFWRGINLGSEKWMVTNCEIGHTADEGFTIISGTATVQYCFIHDCGAEGIDADVDGLGLLVQGNIIYNCTGDGINWNQSSAATNRGPSILSSNTISNCGGDGIDWATSTASMVNVWIYNNILANNGGYGLNFSAGGATLILLQAYHVIVTHNGTFNNTSGAYNPSAIGINGQTSNPTFTNAAGGDFSINTNLRALGYPTTNVGKTSSTRSYVDIGAVQRQEPAGGAGGVLRNPGTTGGCDA